MRKSIGLPGLRKDLDLEISNVIQNWFDLVDGALRITIRLNLQDHFILFGKIKPGQWRGGNLSQLLNQDEQLKEYLRHANNTLALELPAIWIVGNEKEKMVRVHIPFVKRFNSKQLLNGLTIAEQIDNFTFR